ncbi:hypothetical protein Lal_00021343 [Lupinus albus]|nr:hypothetical protein Lal_00021343 [Lupinus albus]
MLVGDYAAKFEELARFCPYSALEMDGRSKCSKFESGLKTKLKMMFGHQEIADFPTLVNNCRMYKDDLAADEVVTPRVNHPRNFGPQRNHTQDKGKGRMFEGNHRPYEAPTCYRGRNDQRWRPSDVPSGGVSTPLCNMCGRLHYGSTCPGSEKRCFYCKELGHIKRFCPKLSRRLNVVHVERERNTGRVFTLSGAEVPGVDGMAQGKCMVAGIFHLVLFDSGATHSLSLPFDLVVSTPTSGLLVVSTFMSKFPIVVNGSMFTVDLFCLSLSLIDLILGTDW